jgi:sulfur relay (sulfurtransferase) complex TusBCD TusD component (DsrE family)
VEIVRRLESLYESFVDKGGTVLLCPHCAEEMGLTRGELRTGVEIGDMESIAELIGRASKVIDY